MLLRDIEDKNKGLKNSNNIKEITTYEHIIQIDTRDCIGEQSLINARTAFEVNGGRGEANGYVNKASGIFVSPIKIGTTISSINNGILKNGDRVKIEGVQGNTKANGTWIISNVLAPDPDPNYEASFELGLNTVGNNNYAGGGLWLREADNGWPTITDTSYVIKENQLILNSLPKSLKALKNFKLSWASIPRDIIPLDVYFKDLYDRITLVNQTTNTPYEIWDTYIPQEKNYIQQQILGFYSTPLYILRSYQGILALPNQITPPPLLLWNPPTGTWPNQPQPYPYQTVPTYKSQNFTIPGKIGLFYLICSGYGIYDLIDWTSNTGVAATDRQITENARKMLLLAILRPQSLRNNDYIDMIINCSTTSNNVYPFGFGDFQRFLPGPGLQLNYQPGISDGANPATDISPDFPILFPNFLGNVWGPYDTPSDRFQKFGLRDTLQDLFLNGDLNNLLGEPIIKPEIARENIMNDSTYGINFNAFQDVNLENIQNSTNYNIINAMKITPNGFGALNIRALGSGTYYNSRYFSSGGIGPSILGTNGAWSLTGVYGSPNLSDPNAVGPTSITLLVNGEIPSNAEGNDPNNYTDQTNEINHRISWYLNNTGTFKDKINDYKFYILSQIPDTNIIIHGQQVQRNIRVQSTNSEISDSLFNIPIRLSLSSSVGNLEYIEGTYALMSNSDYWELRFLSPKASLDQLNLSFTTYDGVKIPLEKMLQANKYNIFLKNIQRIFGNNNIYTENFTFLYDQLNPTLLNRNKRNISLIFKAECYQYVNIGLNLSDQLDKILNQSNIKDNSEHEFNVRASNFDFF